MFVRESTHDRLITQYHTLGHAYQRLQREKEELTQRWNRLVKQVNAKGGEEFLTDGVIPKTQPQQFTDEELKQLIQLCHPDKHQGKESATRLTTKLNALREAQS